MRPLTAALPVPPVVLAAEDDVAVRMAGVVVIDRDPFELCAEVLLHLCHQAAHKGAEVVVFGSVLGRDDEAKLVAVACGALDERLAVGAVLLGRRSEEHTSDLQSLMRISY